MSYLPLIRELVSAYQVFEAHSAGHIKRMSLTMTQFDVIAALGKKALILKGTMTGVKERPELKGLIEKIPNEEDGRSYKIGLTSSGIILFKIFFQST